MTKSPLNELDTWDEGKLSAELYLVKRQVRPAFNMALRKSMLDHALKLVRDEGLHALVQPLSEQHVAFSVFAQPHLAAIIPQIDVLPNPLRDWAYGKLFGYSEASIGEFLAAKQEIRP